MTKILTLTTTMISVNLVCLVKSLLALLVQQAQEELYGPIFTWIFSVSHVYRRFWCPIHYNNIIYLEPRTVHSALKLIYIFFY